MKFIKYLVSLSVLFSIAFQAKATLEYSESEAKASLQMLDDMLERRMYSINKRQLKIDSLTASLKSGDNSAKLILKIAEEYTAFNNDSALHYLEYGKQLASSEEKVPFILKHLALLPLSGSHSEAVMEFDSIESAQLSDSHLSLYYESGRQMFSYIYSLSGVDNKTKLKYGDRAIECQRKLIELLPDDSVEYKYHLGEYYFYNNEKGKARVLLEKVFETEPMISNYRARAAHHLASIALERNDENTYIYYISQAAIADVASATREVAALQELGSFLYSKKDVNRSYTYLTAALANAVECGATIRMVESSRSLPIIERAKAAQIENKEYTIYAIVCVLVLIMLTLVATLVLLHREITKMRKLQDKLQKANKTKEVYISQFLSLCSIYMDKLNQFCKIANRKISAGKVEDLYKLTKSGKFVEEQSREFYEVFDNAFLHLYPNFPNQVNALLLPCEQIQLKEGELLNTDLRILAFMRLGIEDSSRIAQVLNYSINTIYAYRNRIKAKAINKETFEADIMKISSVS